MKIEIAQCSLLLSNNRIHCSTSKQVDFIHTM